MLSKPHTRFSDAARTWNQRFDRADFLFGTEPNRWRVSQRARA